MIAAIYRGKNKRKLTKKFIFNVTFFQSRFCAEILIFLFRVKEVKKLLFWCRLSCSKTEGSKSLRTLESSAAAVRSFFQTGVVSVSYRSELLLQTRKLAFKKLILQSHSKRFKEYWRSFGSAKNQHSVLELQFCSNRALQRQKYSYRVLAKEVNCFSFALESLFSAERNLQSCSKSFEECQGNFNFAENGTLSSFTKFQ